jgi:hypothetical protein
VGRLRIGDGISAEIIELTNYDKRAMKSR